MTNYPPAVTNALEAVDEEAFVRRPDGNLIPQTSCQQIIADMLSRLDVQPGMTVLEIGTGSGYSTALLAHLAGSEGSVVSLDVVGALVDRARTLLSAHGHANVTVLRADGVKGAPERGPFDRIVAWATPPHLPAAWITQLVPEGVIVAPMLLAPICKSGIGSRIRLSSHGAPWVDQLFHAGFVETHEEEVDQWLVPPYGVDAACRDDSGRTHWLSALWLRSSKGASRGQAVLESLMKDRREIAGPLDAGELAADFRVWLLATQPDGLTTAALGDPIWHIGHTHPTGAALTNVQTAAHTVTAGDPDATEVIFTWADAWRLSGRPRLTDLRPRLTACHDGWSLHATLRP